MGLTEEQQRIRQTGVGASESAAVMGMSPFAGPLDVWRGKVEGWRMAETPAHRRGRILEPAVCQFYVEETGAALTEPGTLRHPKQPLMIATPDRIAHFMSEAERVLQAKTTRFGGEEWGTAGTDEVPRHYLIQVQHEMAVTGLKVADLAVLMGGADFRIYTIQADSELQGMIVEAIERFWRDYVLSKRPPPPDGTDSYSEWLSERYPADRAPLREATEEEIALVSELHEMEAREEVIKERVAELRNDLRNRIGEAGGISCDAFRVTWKKAKDSKRTDWKAVCQDANVSPILIEKHTETTPGSRRLLVRFGGEG